MKSYQKLKAMVKQRHIFEPRRIDILTDKADCPESVDYAKQAILAHNEGLKVIVTKAKPARPMTEAPLFGQVNAKQTNLF